MIERWQSKVLEHAIKVRRGINLTGARQVGKSTLSNILKLEKCKRYSFDDRMVKNAAESDPAGFVRHMPGETIVIDEVQKVPSILDSIKIVLDNDNSKGQYLLTGSSNLLFAKSIKDSLAGRLGRVRLRTLALGEINGKEPSFLRSAFDRCFDDVYPDLNKRDIIHLAFQGGYPEPRELDATDRKTWFRHYLEDLLDKDVRDLTEIRKISQLRLVLDWLLAHSAQFFSVEELAAKAALSKVTVQNYLEALEALYLVDRVSAWSGNDYALIGKRSKWIAADSALLACGLGWDENEVYFDDARCGKLVETWVYQQLASMVEVDGECEIRQYRDNRKREIDFVLSRPAGDIVGIEVKAGQVSSSDFKHLKWFAENMAPRQFTGIVLYSGKDTLRFGEGMYAVPMSALG